MIFHLSNSSSTRYILPSQIHIQITDEQIAQNPALPVIIHLMVTRSQRGTFEPKVPFTGLVTGASNSDVPSFVS